MRRFLANWMKYTDGNKLLSEFTIPGTHDSGSYRKQNNSVATCQTLSIEGQLNSGIRFLDMRLKRKNKTLRVYHGIVNMDLNFEQVLNVCKSFLSANPTETIIMSIKHENNDHSKEFENEVWAFIQRFGIFYTGDQLPKLDNVRGKIVLFRRYWAVYSPEPKGLDAYDKWPDKLISEFNNCGVNFCVQDQFKHWGSKKADKFNSWVKPVLDQASSAASDPKMLFINFTSGVGLTAGVFFDANPRDMANTVNPLFLEYIKHFEKKRFGIVPMDFPEYPERGNLIKKLIALNEFHRTVRPDLNGKRLHKISNGQVYLVIDGILRYIPNPETADRIFGKDWGVDDAESPECITMGETLPANALLINFKGETKIYFSYKEPSSEKFVLRHIPNPAVMTDYGLFGHVELKPAETFSSYTVGLPLPAPQNV